MRLNNNYASDLGSGCTDGIQAADTSKIQEIIDGLQAAITLTYHLENLADSILPVHTGSASASNKEEEPSSKFNKAHSLSRVLMDRVQASHSAINRIHRDLVG